MSLLKQIQAASAQKWIETYISKIENYDLAIKFQVVNRSPFAIPLGLCGLKPEVEYNIVKIERVEPHRILVHIDFPKRGLYQLVSFFPSRHTSIMIINGKAFEGTFNYEYTDGRLKMCAGNTSCIT
jgi:hypothetical protein